MNKTSKKSLLKDVIQAVVVENCNKKFLPVCSNASFLPLVNRKIINYTLEWLSISGVQDVIMFYNNIDLKQYIEHKQWFGLSIKVYSAEGCHSLGDVMRVLDRLAIIRNNFILLSTDMIGNFNFIPVLEKFKTIQNTDKGASMMIIYKEVGKDSEIKSGSVVAYNNSSLRVLLHHLLTKNRKLKIPLDILLDNDNVHIRCDIMNTNAFICSLAIPPLFSDNFDFQTINDLIKEMLTNDEVLSNTLYCYFLEGTAYVANISDWPTYQRTSRDIIHRWLYPLTPDSYGKYNFRRDFVYIENRVSFDKNCILDSDVVINKDTTLENNVYIKESIIGENCFIGKNTIVENSFIFDGVRIENNCVIKNSVISEMCILKSNCVVENGSIFGQKIILQDDSKVNGISLISNASEFIKNSKKFTKFGASSFIFKHHLRTNSESDDEFDHNDEVSPGLICNKEIILNNNFDDSDDSSASQSSCNESIMDDVNIFYSEIVDSLTASYEEKLNCENLVLEINSSRYAYNISVNEVNFNLVKAIFLIKPKMAKLKNNSVILQQFQERLTYFMPLLKNYIKNLEAQNDCLLAIEEIAKTDDSILPILSKIIHFFYDKDVLNEEVILAWHNNAVNSDIDIVRKSLSPFIKWLKEADEESEESD